MPSLLCSLSPSFWLEMEIEIDDGPIYSKLHKVPSLPPPPLPPSPSHLYGRFGAVPHSASHVIFFGVLVAKLCPERKRDLKRMDSISTWST